MIKMIVHFSDLLFIFLQKFDSHNFTITESPLGVKVVEWIYDDDKLFVGIFTYENVLIAYHFE
jgi:hypothetical protein